MKLSTNCPDCDAKLATLADHEAWLEAGEPDDFRPNLCWARPDIVMERGRASFGEFTLVCMRKPIDWRARALEAEARLEGLRERLRALSYAISETKDGRERAALVQAISDLDGVVLLIDGAHEV